MATALLALGSIANEEPGAGRPFLADIVIQQAAEGRGSMGIVPKGSQ